MLDDEVAADDSRTPVESTIAVPRTLSEAIAYFSSSERCRTFLVSRRWPDGVSCPRCGSRAVYLDASRGGWECKTRHPKRKFTLKTGTVFEDSALGLDKWLTAIWMIANVIDLGPRQLASSIGLTEKTAWFMLHRVRLAVAEKRQASPSYA